MISSSAAVLPPLVGATKEQNHLPVKAVPRREAEHGVRTDCSRANWKSCPRAGRPSSAWSPFVEVRLQHSSFCLLAAQKPFVVQLFPALSVCGFLSFTSTVHPAHLQDFSSVSTTSIREQTYNPLSGCQSLWISVIFSAMNCITALSLDLEEQGVNIIYLHWRLDLNHLIVPLICQIIPKLQGIMYSLNRDFFSIEGYCPRLLWFWILPGRDSMREGMCGDV